MDDTQIMTDEELAAAERVIAERRAAARLFHARRALQQSGRP